jgi:nucleoside-diphosphate-sugar epimerase
MSANDIVLLPRRTRVHGAQVQEVFVRIFVTGATGHIGSALVPELIAAGHEITALVRTDTSALAASRLGARVQLGDLEDLDGLRRAAMESDGVVHLAFRHDLMREGNLSAAVAIDFAAIKAIGEALEGSGKAFVGVSGTLTGIGRGKAATEEDTMSSGPRIDAENYVVGLAAHGVRSSVVRLSPITHSPELDRHGFATVFIAIARQTEVSAYIGDGANRWSAAHTKDSAHLFRLALEKAPAGSRLHAVDDEAVTIKEIASAIGEHLGLPIVSISPEDAVAHFGFLAGLLQLDAPTSSAITRRLVDWHPIEPGLLADLHDARYYRQ